MTPFDDDIMKPKLPEWLNFGQQQSPQPEGGGFVSKLKKILNQPQMKAGQEGAAAGKAAVSEGAAGGGAASL